MKKSIIYIIFSLTGVAGMYSQPPITSDLGALSKNYTFTLERTAANGTTMYCIGFSMAGNSTVTITAKDPLNAQLLFLGYYVGSSTSQTTGTSFNVPLTLSSGAVDQQYRLQFIRPYVTAFRLEIEFVFPGGGGGTDPPDEDPVTTPPQNITATGDNYTRTTAPLTGKSSVTFDPANNELVTYRYFDGLGRPVETVQTQFTPSKKDLVTLQDYDELGRESYLWLPAPTGNTTGAFVSDISAAAKAAYGNDDYPYFQPVYEFSPLNRVEKQYGPGEAWHTAGRSLQTAYLINDNTAYPCHDYAVSGDNLVKNGNCADNSLYATKVTDEDNKISYEFRDKLDRMILQRRVDTDGNYDTYYVYDDFNNLRFMLPPMIADDISSANLNNYAYIYKYDSRNRCTEKKLPGAEPVYYVYDKADHLIFSQDGELRNQSGRWHFSIPDAQGRIVLEGICTSPSFSGVAGAEYQASPSGTFMNYGYTLSGISFTLIQTLQVNYYDNYQFMTLAQHINNNAQYSYTTPAGFEDQWYGKTDPDNYKSKGLLTGAITAMLDNSTSLHAVFYYDLQERLIESIAQNHLGGFEKEYTNYSFTGNPLWKKHIHSAANKPDINEIYRYGYDHADRPTTTHYQLDDNPAPVLLSDLGYDESGRVSRKDLGNSEKMTYTYNIRSWLKKIDCPNVFTETLYYEDSGIGNTPLYNGNISATRIYNGVWANSLPPGEAAFYPAVHTGYNYEYDGLNRLKKSQFTENGSINNRFNEEFTYDKQGNILTLKRDAMIYPQTTPQPIDNLTLEYTGNQLKKVTEAVTSLPYGFVKPSGSQEIEYAYNKNGSMTKDFNRGISDIAYNILNLPDRITFNAGRSTQYSYDAMGTKRRVKHTEAGNAAAVTDIPVNPHIRARFGSVGSGQNQTVTDYCGPVIYENDELKYILNPEGYVYKTGNEVHYDYYIRDHLGNNWKAGDQINNYYPSGMVNNFISSNSGKQPYKYGGKELDEVYGLNWYDYEARQRDGIVPVFTTMDPRAEKYPWSSPYAYCKNNPIKYIDPDGRSTRVAQNEDGTYTIVGGDLDDDDLNIYVYTKDKNGDYTVRGNSIGVTTSITSFYDSYANEGNGAWAMGSILNPNDNSGDIFLQGLLNDDPSLVGYMKNATKGEKYDFKATNNTGQVDESLDWYRGMPITNTEFTTDNLPTYTSAKDIGNMAAGYVAATKGLTWKQARFGFDALQKKQDWSLKSVELPSSQNAQHYGFMRGQRRLIINGFTK